MDIETIYRNLSITEIERFIADGQEENLYLDFKTVSSADLTFAPDKKNLAKALSGFANSSGGIIIWGVDARKNADGVDCAIGKREIDHVPLLISRLNELTGMMVSPLVDGVEHRPILSSGDCGFAASYIPASDSGPHMAKGGEDRYYKRSGDSFYKMEHFDIADMFGRRRRPKLSLVAELRQESSEFSGGRSKFYVKIYVSIRNDGRGIARAPYLAIDILSNHQLAQYGLTGNGEGLPRLPHSGLSDRIVFGAGSDFVIHAGTSYDVTALYAVVDSVAPEVEDVVIEYELTAEEAQITSGCLSIPGEDIEAASGYAMDGES